jgi:putative endonuclease
MDMNKREVGSRFEQRAADFLMEHGYVILEYNFRSKMGEIDLIAKDEDYLCFIEVKFRSNLQKGFPAEAITPQKIKRIIRTAQFYMLLHKIPEDTPCRFDVVDILKDNITLIKNAFYGM